MRAVERKRRVKVAFPTGLVTDDAMLEQVMTDNPSMKVLSCSSVKGPPIDKACPVSDLVKRIERDRENKTPTVSSIAGLKDRVTKELLEVTSASIKAIGKPKSEPVAVVLSEEEIERRRVKYEKSLKSKQNALDRLQKEREMLESTAVVTCPRVTTVSPTNSNSNTVNDVDEVCSKCSLLIASRENRLVIRCYNKCRIVTHYDCWNLDKRVCIKCEGQIRKWTQYSNNTCIRSGRFNVAVKPKSSHTKKQTYAHVGVEFNKDCVEVIEQQKRQLLTGWRTEDTCEYEAILQKNEELSKLMKDKAKQKRDRKREKDLQYASKVVDISKKSIVRTQAPFWKVDTPLPQPGKKPISQRVVTVNVTIDAPPEVSVIVNVNERVPCLKADAACFIPGSMKCQMCQVSAICTRCEPCGHQVYCVSCAIGFVNVACSYNKLLFCRICTSIVYNIVRTK